MWDRPPYRDLFSEMRKSRYRGAMSLMKMTPWRAARMRAQASWSCDYSTRPGPVGPVPSLVLPVEQWFCTDLSSTPWIRSKFYRSPGCPGLGGSIHRTACTCTSSAHLYQIPIGSKVPNPMTAGSQLHPHGIPDSWRAGGLGASWIFLSSLPWATVFLYLLHGPSHLPLNPLPQHWELFSLMYFFF